MTSASQEVPAGSGDAIPREIWVLIASAFVIAVGFGLITPVLPQFAQSFGVGATASSIVVSAFAFFRLIGAPGGGRLVSKLGERPVYLAGLLIVAASTAATAFAHSYWQLLLFRSVGGLGSTMFTVSALALIVRLAPVSIRARVSSSYASAFLIGGVMGPVIGGQLGGLGLRVPFLAYAGFLVLAAAVVAAAIPSQRRTAEGPAVDQREVLTLRLAWPDSAYRAALASGFANGWSNFGVRNAIVPLFAAAAISADTGIAGAALAVFAAGNALSLLTLGRRSDRVGRRPMVLIGLLTSGVATVLTGFSGSLIELLTWSAIAGIGSGMMNPAQQASVADVVGRERQGGPALASFQMAGDTGAILGPIVAGALVDWGSYSLAFGVTGAVTLLAALPWWWARETMPSRERPSRERPSRERPSRERPSRERTTGPADDPHTP